MMLFFRVAKGTLECRKWGTFQSNRRDVTKENNCDEMCKEKGTSAVETRHPVLPTDSHGKDVEALGSCCRPKSPSQIKRDGGKMRLRNQKDLSKDSCVPALCQCCCVELLCASADCAAA